MTLQERLNKRIDLLIDVGCSIDPNNDMLYVNYNRKLDCSLTWLRYLTRPRFTKLLEDCQEAFIKYNEKIEL